MPDVVVTVPMKLWDEWIAEGDLPGQQWSGMSSHFWFWSAMPAIRSGERVYVVAHGKLHGYAPLVDVHENCPLRRGARCLMRRGGAVAVTILEEAETAQGEAFTRPATIRGFRGRRYRWWDQSDEVPFPDWRNP